ncbi:hypothetical protein X566_17680 [Afipia sp. P52-10]|uniref:hypothetical protein n=1 Tax=Afipia sp. P52-10 TaxID=1429916 RepID=UPI0003DEFA7D|nr:hypothetical protein [Afipia sp. P52-10]ETR76454.1 hypothetical protein X566_17680 [Afipia sp. P52-10]
MRGYIVVCLVVAGITGLAYRALDRTIMSLGCFQPPPAGHFIAYCSSPGFGDYYLTEIGRLLGVRVALPKLDGLTSFDGSHLSADSAERWSAALLREIGDTLESCAKR